MRLSNNFAITAHDLMCDSAIKSTDQICGRMESDMGRSSEMKRMYFPGIAESSQTS